jgi:hypothetical protein
LASTKKARVYFLGKGAKHHQNQERDKTMIHLARLIDLPKDALSDDLCRCWVRRQTHLRNPVADFVATLMDDLLMPRHVAKHLHIPTFEVRGSCFGAARNPLIKAHIILL